MNKYFFAHWAHVHRLKTLLVSVIFINLYLFLFYNNEPLKPGQVLMQVPKCQCSKYVDYKPMETQKYGPENGTCSKESWIRGPGQKVVGKFFGKSTISK